MKLFRRPQNLSPFHQGVIATIGNFDGMHLGHQQLLLTARAKALEKKCPLLVILFEPQPREYFQKESSPSRLSSFREKIQFLQQAGIDWVYCIPFDNKLAHTNAEEFAQYLFTQLHVRYLMIGKDFRFGFDRAGDFSLLKRLAPNEADVVTVPDVLLKGKKVSSTRIRHALEQGDLALANALLGRPYSLCARVVTGSQRGRQWGLPTANFSLKHRVLAMSGVFVVQARRTNTQILQGVANIGTRPTVDGLNQVLEVHLFDFNDSLYGERLTLFFLHKLRDEVKFSSVDDLITQIHQDISNAKQFFNPVFSE
jgi:riboflavin kinase/FMN adenylyltransferase